MSRRSPVLPIKTLTHTYTGSLPLVRIFQSVSSSPVTMESQCAHRHIYQEREDPHTGEVSMFKFQIYTNSFINVTGRLLTV